jgi:hypothetical protein
MSMVTWFRSVTCSWVGYTATFYSFMYSCGSLEHLLGIRFNGSFPLASLTGLGAAGAAPLEGRCDSVVDSLTCALAAPSKVAVKPFAELYGVYCNFPGERDVFCCVACHIHSFIHVHGDTSLIFHSGLTRPCVVAFQERGGDDQARCGRSGSWCIVT